VIIGLVQVAKRVGLKARWCPILAVFFGVVFSSFITAPSIPSLLQGIIFGLAAVGLYSGVKNTFERLK